MIHYTTCFTKVFISYPYNMQNLHEITNTDKRKRVIFVRHCQNQHKGMSEYSSKIAFPHECIFRLNGSVNTQSSRIWSTELPVEGRQTFPHSLSIMVWCEFSKEKVIGPYFFQDQNLNSENYRNVLTQYAFPRLASTRAD